MTAVERMLELIAQISDYISEHASTGRFGEKVLFPTLLDMC